jgi:hypothetical protein
MDVLIGYGQYLGFSMVLVGVGMILLAIVKSLK